MTRTSSRIARRAWLGGVLATAVACSSDPSVVVDDPDDEICGLVRSDGQQYCIDVFEASRSDATSTDPGADNTGPARSKPDRVPWVNISWSAAQAACQRRGARLCEVNEWIDACDSTPGAGGTQFVYGDTRDESLCVVDGVGVQPSGSKMTCTGVVGTFDQSGNVWEWMGGSSGTAVARGGSYRSAVSHGCEDLRPGTMVTDVQDALGFRCCRTF